MPKIFAISRIAADCGVKWSYVKGTADTQGIPLILEGGQMCVSERNRDRLSEAVKLRLAIPKTVRKDFGSVPSFVYFISSRDFVKIGVATVIRSRLCELQVGNPEKLEIVCTMLGDVALERDLHDYFSDLHVRGDWFRHEGELRELTDTLRDEPDYLAASRAFEVAWKRVGRAKSRGKSQSLFLPPKGAEIIQLKQEVTR